VPEDASAAWAHFAAGLTHEALPQAVSRTLKALVLDTLATTLAGSTLGPGVPQVLAWARAAGGAPQCALIGLPDRLPAVAAATVNGAAAHALNFDDTTAVGAGHLGPVTFPAAFAAAGVRAGVDGATLLAGLAAGAELMSRIGLAVTNAQTGYTESKPQPTQMPGYLAAAVSGARVLGLDAHATHSALGIAFMQAGGGRQPVLEGAQAKAVYAGFSCQGGMLAALLAQGGLDGACDAFEGTAGYFNTYYGGRYDREALVVGLGERWSLLNVGFKPWPTTGVAHVFIEAAARIRAAHALDPAAVTAIALRGEPHLATFCEPLATRSAPRTSVEAEDSVPFATAKALVHGGVRLADVEPGPAGLGEPAALRLAGLVTYAVDPALGRAGEVSVHLADGRVLTERVDVPPGHRDNPLTDAQRAAKFRDCAAHAGVALSAGALDEVAGLVERLEQVPDVRILGELLAGR
jgi:2-methylcitrate dehydratase PrpD